MYNILFISSRQLYDYLLISIILALVSGAWFHNSRWFVGGCPGIIGKSKGVAVCSYHPFVLPPKSPQYTNCSGIHVQQIIREHFGQAQSWGNGHTVTEHQFNVIFVLLTTVKFIKPLGVIKFSVLCKKIKCYIKIWFFQTRIISF